MHMVSALSIEGQKWCTGMLTNDKLWIIYIFLYFTIVKLKFWVLFQSICFTGDVCRVWLYTRTTWSHTLPNCQWLEEPHPPSPQGHWEWKPACYSLNSKIWMINLTDKFAGVQVLLQCMFKFSICLLNDFTS